MIQRPQFKRWCTTIGLIALALSLSGCVYLRLLYFKNQLKFFDQNVSVQSTERLTFGFHHPIVRDSDFVFISGANPDKIETLPNAEKEELWTWTFEKKRARFDDKPYQMSFRTRFKDGLLTHMEIDETFTQLVGNEVVLAMFRNLANAKINKLRKSMSTELNAKSLEGVSLPSLSEIMDVMGEPTRIAKPQSSGIARCEYEFNFMDPESGKKAGQFKLYFAGDLQFPEYEITSFRISGKAR